MTNDGTNTYQWDGENRLIQVNYSGGGNSQFTYDGLNRCTKIVESTGSTKQLVWSSDLICEARDGSGNLLSQYFEFGQVDSGTTSFSTHDHLLSVLELTDSSGNIKAQYGYVPFGPTSKLQGTLDSDIQYCGYYFHAPSGLNLTWQRAYKPSLGRWLSRDPVKQFENSYAYCSNQPISMRDPSGTDPLQELFFCGAASGRSLVA